MTSKSKLTLPGLFILIVPFSLSFADPAYDAGFDVMSENSNATHYNTYNNTDMIRWKVGESTYVGQVQVNGKKGLGLEAGDGTYVYSLNDQMLSLTIRF